MRKINSIQIKRWKWREKSSNWWNKIIKCGEQLNVSYLTAQSLNEEERECAFDELSVAGKPHLLSSVDRCNECLANEYICQILCPIHSSVWNIGNDYVSRITHWLEILIQKIQVGSKQFNMIAFAAVDANRFSHFNRAMKTSRA